MNKYAIAVISLIENENKVYIINSNTEADAMITALIDFNPDDPDFNEWAKSLPMDIEQIKSHAFNTEIGISSPVLIK
jgi:hypothetical protein